MLNVLACCFGPCTDRDPAGSVTQRSVYLLHQHNLPSTIHQRVANHPQLLQSHRHSPAIYYRGTQSHGTTLLHRSCSRRKPRSVAKYPQRKHIAIANNNAPPISFPLRAPSAFIATIIASSRTLHDFAASSADAPAHLFHHNLRHLHHLPRPPDPPLHKPLAVATLRAAHAYSPPQPSLHYRRADSARKKEEYSRACAEAAADTAARRKEAAPVQQR